MTEQDKKSAAPKEFWILNEDIDDLELLDKPDDTDLRYFTHVIEYSAYQALQIKYDRLWDSRDLAESDLQKRCEELENKAEFHLTHEMSARKENSLLQSKLAELEKGELAKQYYNEENWIRLEATQDALEHAKAKVAEQAAEIERFREKFQAMVTRDEAQKERIAELENEKLELLPHHLLEN